MGYLLMYPFSSFFSVAILQWYAELTTRTRAGTFKVLVYHGADRPTKRADLENVDIVLSTYAIVEGGFRRQNYGFKRKGATVKEPSLLHSIKWGRVVLDEAHGEIKKR